MSRKILLPHEHVFSKHRSSDREAVETFLRNALKQVSEFGISDIVDLTAYVNPLPFLSMINGSGVRVHACIGFYLDNYVRRDLRSKSVPELVRLLMGRYERYSKQVHVAGIKVAARHEKLNDFENRAFRAVSCCQEMTGLPVITHSPDGARAHQLKLMELGVPANRILLSHPEFSLKGRNKIPAEEVYGNLKEIVEDGSWVCITDVYSEYSRADARVLDMVTALINLGLSDRVLISGDVSWRAHRSACDFRGTNRNAELGFLLGISAASKLRSRGVGEKIIRQIYEENPFEFYGIIP